MIVRARVRAAHEMPLFLAFVAALFGTQAWLFSRDALALAAGEWSAPLDDVFIHADYARSLALGFPLTWVPGDGVSSGGTSVLWPVLLAIPWKLGAHGLALLPAARAIAVACLVAAFAALKAPLARVHRLAPWAAAVALGCDGPFLWHALSGMELPLVFAALAVLVNTASEALSSPSPRAWLRVGMAGLFAVLVRPEFLAIAALLGLAAAARAEAETARARATFAACAFLPALAATLALGFVYQLTTGSFSANGVAAKLVHTQPLLTGSEVRERLAKNVVFAVRRVVSRDTQVDPLAGSLDLHADLGAAGFAIALAPLALGHSSGALAFGLFALAWVPLPLLTNPFAQACVGVAFLVPLAFAATKRRGPAEDLLALLVLLGAAWGLVSALNGQVVYHLDRYLMPTRASWLAAAVVAALVLAERAASARARAFSLSCLAIAAFAWASNAGAYGRWRTHFAKACANIREQHVATGRFLRTLEPPVSRVLVNDAGAIPYVSELPALDLVGLGGFQRLPWARANRFGVGASLELLEHVPAHAWPSHMAIYTTWFPGLAENFGREVARFTVHDNVVCGGLDKVVYAADWSPLHRGDLPAEPTDPRAVIDDVDLGDLPSEEAHGLTTGSPAPRDFRVQTTGTSAPIFDGGVRLAGGESLRFRVATASATHFVLRVAVLRHGTFRVTFDDAHVEARSLDAHAFWHEQTLVLPPGGVRHVTVSVAEGSFLVAHAWAINRGAQP